MESANVCTWVFCRYFFFAFFIFQYIRSRALGAFFAWFSVSAVYVCVVQSWHNDEKTKHQSRKTECFKRKMETRLSMLAHTHTMCLLNGKCYYRQKCHKIVQTISIGLHTDKTLRKQRNWFNAMLLLGCKRYICLLAANSTPVDDDYADCVVDAQMHLRNDKDRMLVWSTNVSQCLIYFAIACH